MKVLVTRPEPDATAFADLCRQRGLTPVLAPLMDVIIDNTPVDLKGVGAFAFTSANGVRAFAANSPERGLKTFAVGHATAGAARAQGFNDIVIAGGDVTSLAKTIAEGQNDFKGAVLHAAGADRAGDLIAALDAYNVRARRAVLYQAAAVTHLPAAAADALNGASPPEWAALFSPRTARLFVKLVCAASLEPRLGAVRAACFSAAVAEAAGGAVWKSIETPVLRTADDMADFIASYSVSERS